MVLCDQVSSRKHGVAGLYLYCFPRPLSVESFAEKAHRVLSFALLMRGVASDRFLTLAANPPPTCRTNTGRKGANGKAVLVRGLQLAPNNDTRRVTNRVQRGDAKKKRSIPHPLPDVSTHSFLRTTSRDPFVEGNLFRFKENGQLFVSCQRGSRRNTASTGMGCRY